MRIERFRVAFMAIGGDVLVSFREQLSNRERRREDRATTRRDPQPLFFPSDEARGSYCLRAEGLRTEHPFRPIDEALYPYRAGNRCALNSLDTDRSTTLSPETVTANRVSAAVGWNISVARKNFFRLECAGGLFQAVAHTAFGVLRTWIPASRVALAMSCVRLRAFARAGATTCPCASHRDSRRDTAPCAPPACDAALHTHRLRAVA
jgi:hypothetical protein